MLTKPPSATDFAVWSVDETDADSAKLAARLKIPLVHAEEPPENFRFLFFYEEDTLFLHSFTLGGKPFAVDYLEKEFRQRWKSISRNDIFLKALGIKKGFKTFCDPTCGLGYDAFLIATLPDCEVVACEKVPAIAELVMNALLRLKDLGRFQEFPFFFHFGDGLEFLKSQRAESFDVVYLDPMFPRSEEKSAKQKKEMQIVRELTDADTKEAELFAEAWRVAKHRVVVKRSDDAPKLQVDREPESSIEGKTVRFDLYPKLP
jgi:16S rRNA (guanine1516-N2)-methyltransferase